LSLKPYRFKLPVIGMTLAALLICVQHAFDPGELIDGFNKLINLPASLAFNELRVFDGFHRSDLDSWYNRGLFLSLTGLCWYAVGLELDFDLLRRTASRLLILRVCWLLIAAGLQIFAIYVLYGIVGELRWSSGPAPIYVYFLLGFTYLILLLWVEGLVLRLWRAAQPLPFLKRKITGKHSL
jgi:hypothetical protein